jgi:hypothetical protein
MLPKINEGLHKSIEARLALMDQAAQGNEAARAMLDYTGKASGMAHDKWINENYNPYQTYKQAPMESGLAQERNNLNNLNEWTETSEGSQSRWTGTPEQQERLNYLNTVLDPNYQGIGVDMASTRPDLLLNHLQNAHDSDTIFNPMETYGWDTYLQDNPDMVQRLTDYMGKQQTAQAQKQTQGPQMPMDLSKMTPEEIDMYRKWLGSGADDDMYQRWLGSGAGQDEDYMRMLMGAR